MNANDLFTTCLLLMMLDSCRTKPVRTIKEGKNDPQHQLASSSKESRCGTNGTHHSRAKRYILHNTVWSKYLLTWRIEKYTEDLPKHLVRRIIRRAFRKWSSWTSLTFLEKHHGHVDIKISFEEGYHYPCSVPFDGREGEIAHAYYPYQEQELAGDIHFDDAEDFTEHGHNGKSLPWTALHEIGHSLGLMHSDVWGAVMSPLYASFSHPYQKLALTQDDIDGVQFLYGNPVRPWRTWFAQHRLYQIP